MIDSSLEQPSKLVAIATRTLLAAGYNITNVHRQPAHIEFKCERPIRLGPIVQLLIAITDQEQFHPEQISGIRRAADNQGCLPVFVSMHGGGSELGWTEFMDALGGAVPPWRILSPDFVKQMVTAARNQLPHGMNGEAWQIFEGLVADALEFCFGRRVLRFGGLRRGKPLSDIVAPLPNFDVLVVDAKASGEGFDASWASLRALAEYVEAQKTRQKSGGSVIAALIVSSAFLQDEGGLTSVARRFLGEVRTPVCFVTAGTLGGAVADLLGRPDIRGAVRWPKIFDGGLVTADAFAREIAAAAEERCELRDR